MTENKQLSIDIAEFEMPEDSKLSCIAKALAQEDSDTGDENEASYSVTVYAVSSYGILF